MTARPDVPDTPDRTDAIARVMSTRAICEHESYALGHTHDAYNCDRCDARAILATDDPAAVAALAATLAERHPDALLTALTNAGVLEERQRWTYGVHTQSRLVTVWREVQQP